MKWLMDGSSAVAKTTLEKHVKVGQPHVIEEVLSVELIDVLELITRIDFDTRCEVVADSPVNSVLVDARLHGTGYA